MRKNGMKKADIGRVGAKRAVLALAAGVLCAGILSIGLAARPAVAQDDLDAYLKATLGNSDAAGAAAPAGDDQALPQADVSPRSPGLALVPDAAAQQAASGAMENALVDPFAPPAQTRPQTPEEIEAYIRGKAFDAAITGLLPMKPDEIRKLLERFDETRQAVETPVYPYPEPEVVSETVSLDPGARPPEIKVAVGQVTTLTVLDVTGAPWPIQDVTWAGNFDVVKPEEGGHVLRVTPLSEFTYGNISIRLLKLKTPVTFILRTHRDKVQYRFDARIPEFGPYASVPLMEGGVTLVAGNDVLNAILDGVPPEGATRLDVAGADARTIAYDYKSATYVRTPLTLLSPGWTGSVSSADGMNVYAMSDAPVLLLSDHGKVIRARISKRDDSTDE